LIESGLSACCDAVVGVLAPAQRPSGASWAGGNRQSYARMRIEAQKPIPFFREHSAIFWRMTAAKRNFARKLWRCFQKLLAQGAIDRGGSECGTAA
jgi:hypothetical protein